MHPRLPVGHDPGAERFRVRDVARRRAQRLAGRLGRVTDAIDHDPPRGLGQAALAGAGDVRLKLGREREPVAHARRREQQVHGVARHGVLHAAEHERGDIYG